MDLYVLRHAIALERGHADYIHDDSRRPLTRKGIRRMRRGARGIRRMEFDLDLILSSPYQRARETAAIVVDVLGRAEPAELFQPLSAEVSPEQAIRQLARRTEGLDSVLIVGHEPQLSGIGAVLLGGRDLALELGKGGMFKLELEQLQAGTAVLEWWLTPRQLRRLG